MEDILVRNLAPFFRYDSAFFLLCKAAYATRPPVPFRLWICHDGKTFGPTGYSRDSLMKASSKALLALPHSQWQQTIKDFTSRWRYELISEHNQWCGASWVDIKEYDVNLLIDGLYYRMGEVVENKFYEHDGYMKLVLWIVYRGPIPDVLLSFGPTVPIEEREVALKVGNIEINGLVAGENRIRAEDITVTLIHKARGQCSFRCKR